MSYITRTGNLGRPRASGGSPCRCGPVTLPVASSPRERG